jgi:transposase
VSKQYRPWTPEQAYLLPPSPMEWLPQGHLAYFLLEVVGELDLSAIEVVIHKKDPRGERPHAPQMMTSLIVYAYCTGTFSSRKIERATFEDVALRVIAGGSHPHWTTINNFRLRHRVALSGLFTQVLKMCSRAGLRTLGQVALDGSKVQANASKHKAMSYGRMKDEEKRLAAEIEALMRRAEDVDAAEDHQFGSDKSGYELPAELQHREPRLRRIREVKAELEKEAAEARATQLRENATELRVQAEAIGTIPGQRKQSRTRAAKSEKQADELSPRDDNDDDGDAGGSGGTQLPLHQVPTTPDGKPVDKAQRNFTDPDSRIMTRNGVFMQAYNAQAAVSEDQIIVAHGLTNAPQDVEQLAPMLERIRENCGEMPTILTADSGYISEKNIAYCEATGTNAYIALKKKDAESRAMPTTSAQHARFVMGVKLHTAEGRAAYARRKVIVEPVFGQIKSAMGFRRFSLRGLLKASSEWGIVCACHNLLKLFRAAARQAAQA